MTNILRRAFAVALILPFAVANATAQEPAPQPDAPSPLFKHLQTLGPFIGEWRGVVGIGDDAAKLGEVTTKYAWRQNFSVVYYDMEAIDHQKKRIVSHHAVLSWDAEKSRIRCWGFRNNGDRWDAVWTPPEKEGKTWTAEFTMVDAEGKIIKGKAVKTFRDPDTYVETFANMTDGDGKPVPDMPPFVFTRKKAESR